MIQPTMFDLMEMWDNDVSSSIAYAYCAKELLPLYDALQKLMQEMPHTYKCVQDELVFDSCYRCRLEKILGKAGDRK